MRNDIDIYADNMMLSEQELKAKKLQQSVIDRILRLRDIHAYMLRNPLKKDREYVDYIVYNSAKLGNGGEVTRRTAYSDLEILHALVGSLEKCTKEWHRWRLNNMIMEGYSIAVKKEDAAAIAKLSNVYGKYNQLDKTMRRMRGMMRSRRLPLPSTQPCLDSSQYPTLAVSSTDSSRNIAVLITRISKLMPRSSRYRPIMYRTIKLRNWR